MVETILIFNFYSQSEGVCVGGKVRVGGGLGEGCGEGLFKS